MGDEVKDLAAKIEELERRLAAIERWILRLEDGCRELGKKMEGK